MIFFPALRRHGRTIESLAVTLVYWVQYRYFIFSLQFGDFTETFGTNHSDAYYALSIIYQNFLNLAEGRWYSLAGDHYTWYESIIGTTHHMYAWTPLAWVLAQFWDEPLGIYNLLYFLNLFVLQFGVYRLLHFYTRARLIPLLVSLLVPLGPSIVGISYGLHPHVSMYAGLPWILYGLERVRLAKTKIAELRWGGLVGVGYVYLLLSDWHSAIFAHVLLVPYALYYLARKPFGVRRRWRIGVITGSLLLPLLVTVPLGLGFVETSRTFNTTRSLRVISILQRGRNNLNNSLGLGTVAGPAFENVYPRLPSKKTEKERVAVARRFTNTNRLYPDVVTTGVFWVGLLCVLSYLWLDRRRLRERSFFFYGVLVLCSLIALGPYVVIGSEIGTVKLPYYYIYKLVYPLQAIRYLYRIQAVTYLVALLTLGLWLQAARVTLEGRLLASVSPGRRGRFGVVLFATLVLTLGSVQSISHERIVTEGAEYELGLSEVIADYNRDRRELDYYYFGRDLFDTYNLNLFTSYHNYRRGFRELSWVTHGISGFHPHGERSMEGQMTRGDNYDLIADTLSGQGVDLVVTHVPDVTARQERQIEAHYTEVGASEDGRFKVFALESPAEVTQDWPALTHAVTLSQTQTLRQPVFYTLQIRNDSPDTVYTKRADTATTQPYRLRIYDSEDREVLSEELAYSEPAHLWPGYASAQTFEISPRLNPGTYLARLTYADETKDEREFTVVPRAEYRRRMATAQELQVSSPELGVPSLTRNEVALPLPVQLTVDAGVWQNYPPRTELRPNYSFAADFAHARSGDVQNRRDVCELPGNYFPGDTLHFVCLFTLPFEADYATYRSTFYQPVTQ